MKKILILTAVVIALLFSSCGKSNPTPQNIDNNGNGTGGSGTTGGTGGTGTGGTGTTTYTAQPDINFNTWSASIGYDIKTDSLTSTLTGDASGHAISTAAPGGKVGVAISNIQDTDIKTVEVLGDAIIYHFNENADPILNYIFKDDVKKTILHLLIHTNKEATGGGSQITIQGKKGDFTGTAADYGASWLTHLKSGSQAVQQNTIPL